MFIHTGKASLKLLRAAPRERLVAAIEAGCNYALRHYASDRRPRQPLDL